MMEVADAQLGRAAHQFAIQLSEQNVSKTDKVIFWSENRPEWLAAFWGCILAGVVVVPIDHRMSVQLCSTWSSLSAQV